MLSQCELLFILIFEKARRQVRSAFYRQVEGLRLSAFTYNLAMTLLVCGPSFFLEIHEIVRNSRKIPKIL